MWFNNMTCTIMIQIFLCNEHGGFDHVMPGSKVNIGSAFMTSPKANSASKSSPERGPLPVPKAPAIRLRSGEEETHTSHTEREIRSGRPYLQLPALPADSGGPLAPSAPSPTPGTTSPETPSSPTHCPSVGVGASVCYK